MLVFKGVQPVLSQPHLLQPFLLFLPSTVILVIGVLYCQVNLRDDFGQCLTVFLVDLHGGHNKTFQEVDQVIHLQCGVTVQVEDSSRTRQRPFREVCQ